MKKITKYLSFDNKEFDTERECVAHEEQCDFISSCKDSFTKFLEESISKAAGKKDYASYWSKLNIALNEIHDPTVSIVKQNQIFTCSLEETRPGAVFQCVGKDDDIYPDIYVSLNTKKIKNSPYIKISNKLVLAGYIPILNITKETLHFRAPSTQILLLGAVPNTLAGF